MKHLPYIAITLYIFTSSLSFATPPAPVPQTGQTACYNSSGTVVPCAGTGQDGDIKAGVAWPDPRFTDHNNGTVTDNLTGLMWTKDANAPGPTDCTPAVTKTWVGALDYVACLNANQYLGYSDWRVPSIRELGGLVDASRSNPALPPGHPFTSVRPYTYYWSGSTINNTNVAALVVSTYSGGLNSFYNNTLYPVWPVRSGGFVAPAPTPKTGVTLSYATGGDGALQSGVAWPTPRFTDNGNGTVTDNLTGLTWLKNGGCYGVKTWDAALVSANSLVSGACGLSDGSESGDWHLPNKNELWSLVDYGRSYPALPAEHPFGVASADYWSSSTLASNTIVGESVNMSFGTMLGEFSKTKSLYVWPVRSWQFWTFGPLKLSATAPDLGNIPVNSTSAAQEIKIRNKGTSDLFVSSISMTGNDADQFSVVLGGSNACSSLTPTLAPDTSCTVLVSVTPTSSGTKSATLSVVTTSATGSVPLTATAYSTVVGAVTDLSTGTGLAGATVYITGGASTTSDANGKFQFYPAPALGTYSATVSKTGYTGYATSNLTTTATSSAVANFYLAPTGSLNFVSNASLTGAETGVNYNNRLKITGGTSPYGFAIVSGFGDLPPGLSLNSTSGLINGTPTTGGSYTFWAGCMDSLGIVTEKEFTINVSTPLSITTPAPVANISATLPYSLTLGATGGTAPYTFVKTSGTLPTGLTLSSAGVLSGTPAIVGPYSFAVTVTDAFGRTSTKSFSITVETPLVISISRLNDGIIGAAYNLQLTATGNIGSIAWNLASGSLPTGLQLNGASGIISGTPSSIETQSITISVQDAGGRTSSKQYIIKTGNPLQISTTTMPTGYLTLAYSSPVQSSGGIAPITYNLTSGTLPAGLVLNTSTGLISGTPTSGGVLANITVTATDSSYPTPQSVQQALSIRVLSTLPQYTITLSLLDGSSPASVTGSMNCTVGTTCQPAQFNLGTTVTLTAVSDPTTLFTGWSGACTGTASTCSFYVDTAKSVTATFVVRPKYNLTLLFAGGGNGQVNGDITCTSGGACAPKQFLLGTTALLLPTPDVNSLFDGWSGACAGLGNCSVTMDAAKGVTATFASGQSVKVKENSKTFSSLQAAYNDLTTVTGNTIMGRSVLLTETLTLNRPIDVTIRGGYDTTFTTNDDVTAIKGQVIIRNGSLIADKLTIW